MNTKKTDANKPVRGNPTRGGNPDRQAKPGPKGTGGGGGVNSGKVDRMSLGVGVAGGEAGKRSGSPRPGGSGVRSGVGVAGGEVGKRNASPRPGGGGMMSAPSSGKEPGKPKPFGKKERFSTDMASLSPQAKQALIDLQLKKLEEKETPKEKEMDAGSTPGSGMKGITPIKSDEKVEKAERPTSLYAQNQEEGMEDLYRWAEDLEGLREEEKRELEEEERLMGRSKVTQVEKVISGKGSTNTTPNTRQEEFRTPGNQRPLPNMGSGTGKRTRPGSSARRRLKARLAKEAGMSTPGSEAGTPIGTPTGSPRNIREQDDGMTTPRGAGEGSGANTGALRPASLGRGKPPSASRGRGLGRGLVTGMQHNQARVLGKVQEEGAAGGTQGAGPGRITWSQVAQGAMVAELSREDKTDCKHDDLDLLFDRLNRMICVASKPKPFIRRLSLTKGGKLRVACDDERTLVWLKENVSDINREQGKGYKFTPPGECTILYTMRIRQESWVRDPEFIRELLLEMNDPLNDMQIRMEGELYQFDKERGGAVLKISMLEKAMDFLKSVEFRPRLGVGRVTLWGPGHRYRREERMVVDQVEQGEKGNSTGQETGQGHQTQENSGKDGQEAMDLDREEEEMNQGITNLVETASMVLAQDE